LKSPDQLTIVDNNLPARANFRFMTFAGYMTIGKEIRPAPICEGKREIIIIGKETSLRSMEVILLNVSYKLVCFPEIGLSQSWFQDI
jgi:hypothetical protein